MMKTSLQIYHFLLDVFLQGHENLYAYISQIRSLIMKDTKYDRENSLASELVR